MNLLKCEILAGKLLQTIQTVITVVEKRQTTPILSNLYLSAENDLLVLVGSDSEIELGTQVEATIHTEGKITVSARKLLDICRALPAEAMVNLEAKDNQLTLRSGRSRFQLATLPAEDYPLLGQPEAAQSVQVEAKTLQQLISATQFAMAVQDVRYYLNGLLLHWQGNSLRAVATDGHRLAYSEKVFDVASSEDRQVIVPRKAVNELSRLLADQTGIVDLQLNAQTLYLVTDGVRLTSRLIEGRFPDYVRVIPSQSNKQIVCPREVLRSALSRAAILSNEKYRGVRLTCQENVLKIQAQNPQNEEAEEEVLVTYTGESLEISFNVGYLLDALNALESETAVLFLQSAEHSGLVQGLDDTSRKYVVMPMRL